MSWKASRRWRAAGFGATLCIGILGGTTAWAEPQVTGYDPRTAACGEAVTIEGTSFGRNANGRSVRYGQTSPMGTVSAISRWSRHAIEVRLPRSLSPGLYWLAIYGTDGSPESNQLRTLAVTCDGAREFQPGGVRAAPPPAVKRPVVQPPGKDEIFRDQFGRKGGGADMASEVARRARPTELGIRVQDPRNVRVGESASINLEIRRRNREGAEARVVVAARLEGDPSWQRTRVNIVPAGAHFPTTTPSLPVTADHVGAGADEVRMELRLENPDQTLWRDADASNDQASVAVPVTGTLTYRITTTFRNVQVRGRCDSLSPGDWRLGLAAWEPGRPDSSVSTSWPEGSDHDVDDGDRIARAISVRQEGVPYGAAIRIAAWAVDCDSDSPLLRFIAPIPSQLESEAGYCGGEEVHEVTGSNDRMEYATDEIPADEWRRAPRYDVQAGDADCGWTGRLELDVNRE